MLSIVNNRVTATLWLTVASAWRVGRVGIFVSAIAALACLQVDDAIAATWNCAIRVARVAVVSVGIVALLALGDINIAVATAFCRLAITRAAITRY